MQKIMIIAPHPDDEACGCASIIMRNLKRGNRINVVYLTDGENKLSAFYAPGEVRKAEARKAMGKGVRLTFLDFKELSINSKEMFAKAKKAVERAIMRFRPDEIYVTAYEGGHYDHDIANALAKKAECGKAATFEFPMYNPFKNIFSKPRGEPMFLQKSLTKEIYNSLSGEEMREKRRMLSQYNSQNPEDILVQTYSYDEKFRSLPDHDYMKLPCPVAMANAKRLRMRLLGRKEEFYSNIWRNRRMFEEAIS